MPVREVFIDLENFKRGLYALEDTTKAPFGTARVMSNIRVTTRGGIAPRLGTKILGTENSSTSPVKGLYNFRKSFEQDEFLLKAYDDELEVYSKNHTAAGWWRLKNGFTTSKEFGFVSSLVNEDNQDYVIFCNRYDPYQRWQGAVALLSGALSGGETSIVVDSVLTAEVFEDKTASSASATTVDVSGTPWAADQWIGFYIYIKTGTHAGKIRLITDNTSSQLTFDTLGTSPGTAEFEIRQSNFPASGTVIYAGTTIAYTAIPEYNKLSVSSAHAGANGAAVALVPTEYPGNPRGNRLANYLSRIIVGNVRSAIARGSGGALQGNSSAGSYFVSKLGNPFDFTFSASRAAGEGDIIGTPYGGGDITGVVHQEDSAYIFKNRYIESVKYSQDSNDLAVREPLKAGIGSNGEPIKGSDDIYFATIDNKITSIGRIRAKDIKPQTENIGFKIQRLLDNYVFGTGRGIEYKDIIYIPAKSSSAKTVNDIILVYNKIYDSFEGVWNIPINDLEEFNSGLYGGSSLDSNVIQLLTGNSDVEGDDRFPISSEYATHFMSLVPSNGMLQALNSLYFEGYIKGNSSVTFKVWKDFYDEPFLSFDFSGTESNFLDGKELSAFLGSKSLGLQPIGSISDPDSEGRRHFYFRVYFPFQYGNHFSVGFESSNTDIDYEITRFGLGLKESVSTDTTKIKSV